MRFLLLLGLVVFSGCVPSPRLPDTAMQSAEFGRQPFSPDYQVAITSYYKDTKVKVDVSRKFVKFVSSQNEAERIMRAEQANRDSIASDFSFNADIYNRSASISSCSSPLNGAKTSSVRKMPSSLRIQVVATTADPGEDRSGIEDLIELVTSTTTS